MNSRSYNRANRIASDILSELRLLHITADYIARFKLLGEFFGYLYIVPTAKKRTAMRLLNSRDSQAQARRMARCGISLKISERIFIASP